METIEVRRADNTTGAAARGQVLRLMQGFQVSQAIHVAVVLGLPDLLSAGPRSASDLVVETRTNASALHRLMRALAVVGVFREDDERRFEVTAMGATLCTDAARSLAPIARLQCRSSHWQAWGNLLHAVQTGASAFEHVHGNNVWRYRAEHREEGDAFDNAMAAFAAQVADVFLEVCDFNRTSHVVDVGGGDGTFLARILEANLHLHGTLLDQPQVMERARVVMDAANVSDRCKLIGGDFFETIPSGGDVYVLKWILHDWDDAAAARILRSCRSAMPADCRLVIVEHVVGPPNSSSAAALRDLHMLVVTGGRERTRDEFAELLSNAGFAVRSLVDTTAAVSVIEAVAV